MLKSVIISGPPAIGKTTVAKGLAKEFHLKYISGGDVLKELAQEQGFDTAGDDWWDTQDGIEFLKQRKENLAFDKKVDDKLKEIFTKGGMVMTSYTLPWLVKGGIKIWLAGTLENSAKRMTTRDKINHDSALDIVNKRYEENKTIYRKLYGFNFGEDLSVFDKIINTDGLDANEVLLLTKSAIKKLL